MPKFPRLLTAFFFPLFFLLLWAPSVAQAQGADFFEETCKEDQCCLQYTEAMQAAEADWNTHVNQLMAEAKPTSRKVEQAFDSLRTYDCWIRYICESVLVSALVDPRELLDGLRAENLNGALPGCQVPEKVRLGSHWNEFVEALEDQSDLIAAVNQPNRIAYFPACMTNPPTNEQLKTQDLEEAELHHQNCLAAADLILGCQEEECDQPSTATAGLELRLKKDHAQHRAGAMERKLYDLNRRMIMMQAVVEQVKNFFQSLNLRYECAPEMKCTGGG